MVRREDDYGQVDGELEQPSPYATSMRSAPWLRGGMSPWHMWGNLITIDPLQAFTQPEAVTGQLIRVSYKRPETWHWVMAARLLRAPEAGAGGTYVINIDWDLIIGLGRATTEMRNFERFTWTWTGVAPGPTGYPMWSTSALAPTTDYSEAGGVPTLGPRREIDQLVAQDIQLNCRVTFTAIDEPLGGSAAVEVSAFFAPKHHARPDWFNLRAPADAQFTGEELAGR